MRGLENGSLDDPLLALYGADALDFQRGRVSQLLTRMQQDFGLAPTLLTSSPGRTELGGNHTDHNHGRVLTAAVHLDCLAAVVSTQTRVVTIHSQGFPEPIVVNLDDTALRPGEEGTPTAIVRGVADGLRLAGHGLAGFNACVSSEVPMGSGLSSSAAFEVLIGRIFNELANGGALSTLELARVARLAENTHFGKPCGFMDQIACAFMGVLQIDFDNPANPGIERVDWDFEAVDYVLAVVNTGGSHANLTPDYAAIPAE
ncbi:MAG: galactokinase, partial [Proteobacteria bacterium]|nr:galactokinase [Pseudomonadota bacterium]